MNKDAYSTDKELCEFLLFACEKCLSEVEDQTSFEAEYWKYAIRKWKIITHNEYGK